MDKRVVKLRILLSPTEKLRIEQAAAKQKVTISDFIRLAVNEKTACMDGSDILRTRAKIAA